jgi:hypothetical protein
MEPGICMQADGVLPIEVGYAPFPGLTVVGTATALSDAPRGMLSYQKSDGTWTTVAGTPDTIEEKASDDTWSAIGTGFTLSDGDDWCLLRFGTKLLATNTGDGLQAYDVETPAGFSAVSAAGKPRWVFECGNMLFGLDCLNRDDDRDNRLIRSSKFSRHDVWTGAGTDYQPVESGGALLWGGKVSDTAALVLQQRAVRLIQVGNVGGGALWGLTSLADEFGAVGARSCVAFDGQVFWPSTDGFRRFTLGGGIERIGAGKIDRWFLDNVDQSNMALIQGAVDPFRKCVLWRYKSASNGSSTIFEDIIGYNWAFQKWFTLTLQTTFLAYAATSGVTWATATGTWADQDVQWASRTLQGGQPLFGAMNGSHKFGYFAGDHLAATLETSIANDNGSLLINWATPIDDASTGTLSLGVKDQLSDDTTWKTGVAKTSSGDVPVRGRGKNFGFRRVITAASDWTAAKGVDHVGANRGGRR